MTATLTERAVEVLSTADAAEKARLSRTHAAAWLAARAAGQPAALGTARPPPRPARPARPVTVEPRDVPRRRSGSAEGRAALLHAIAHIELNAIDLHWDIVARFAHVPMPLSFHDAWVKAAAEEARHFELLSACLAARGLAYGDLPAHAGLWQAAEDTADDLPARLAVVPMVLEARGLDVTPEMIALFRAAGEADAVAALETILREEIAHVAHGTTWFNFLCGRDDRDPTETFRALVRTRFRGRLKPPFNEAARAEAGLPPDFYWPLVARPDASG